MAAACSILNATGSTGVCASKPWPSSGGAMLFLPNMQWLEASQNLLLSSGTGSVYRVHNGFLFFLDCRILSCCLLLLAGNAPWQCQSCQANMSATCQHMIVLFLRAADQLCVAVALARFLAQLQSCTCIRIMVFRP